MHRDFKRANVLRQVGDDGAITYKVCDFGMSRALGEDASATSDVGTATTMAPEVALGYKYGCSTDLWSLGVVMYECLTRRMLFLGNIGALVRNAVVHSTLPECVVAESVLSGC